MKKILFCTGEGIGNVIQTIPVLRTLKETLNYEIHFFMVFGSYAIPKDIFPYVSKWFNKSDIRNIDLSEYHGKVFTWWVRNYPGINFLSKIPLLNKPVPFSYTRSEVDCYMQIARDLGAKEDDLIWYGNCNYNKRDEKYDIVIHDGYKRMGSFDWSAKSYLYYEEVVKLLKKDFSVCSVGGKNEYIKNTINKTGLKLLDTLGIIKNSKLFLNNDSGLYHCANALEVKNIVIFTLTSVIKNYDRKFHKYSTIIGRDDLKCRPCQGTNRRKNCKKQECRNIDPKVIVDTIKEVLK